MKEIKICPLSSNKCEFKQNHTCIKFDNPNLCNKCTSFRKRQRKTTLYNLKNYNVYRQAGCKL